MSERRKLVVSGRPVNGMVFLDRQAELLGLVVDSDDTGVRVVTTCTACGTKGHSITWFEWKAQVNGGRFVVVGKVPEDML